jgi:hypothetical protein
MVALAAAFGLLSVSPASACAASSRNTLDVFNKASLVLVGDVVSIEPVMGTRSVLLTLRVTERLRGWAWGEVKLSWSADFYPEPPAVWTGDPHIIVAAHAPGTSERIEIDRFWGDQRPDVPAVIPSLCAESGIYPATNDFVSKFRWMLFYDDFLLGSKLLGVVTLLIIINSLFVPGVKRLIRGEPFRDRSSLRRLQLDPPFISEMPDVPPGDYRRR